MAGLQDYLSRTGYNPQFLNTTMPATPSTAPAAGSTDLTNRLLQIMSGQLGGTLSGGEKLSALGALLKSVSRGSQTSPQQVLQGIQQQKLGEVQGAIQIQELRKQAGRQAQRDALREDLLSKARTDEERAQIRILSDESLDKFALQRLENKPPEMEAKQKQLATYFQMRTEDPGRASAYWRLINPTQVVGSIESGLKEYNVPEPLMEGGAGVPTRGGITPLTTPQPKPVEPTEGEKTAGFLAQRAAAGLRDITQITKQNPSAASPKIGTELVRSLFGETAANALTSADRQKVEAAQLDTLDALLTLGTGAAYTAEQLAGYRKSYFPQLNDDPETVAFKNKKFAELVQFAKAKAGRNAYLIDEALGIKAPSPKGSTAGPKAQPSGIKILSVKPRG